MLKVTIKGNEYRLRFGMRALAKTGVLTKVFSMNKTDKEGEKETDEEMNNEMIKNMENICLLLGELFLAGSQKDCPELKYDIEDKDDYEKKLDMVFDILDDYEEDGNDLMELFAELQAELTEKGFLGRMTGAVKDVAEQVDATVIPQDHKTKIIKN